MQAFLDLVLGNRSVEAGTALTGDSTITAHSSDCVPVIEEMPPLAVGLGGIDLEAGNRRSVVVHPLGYCIQMLGIDAWRVPAQMVNGERLWDRSLEVLVGEPVSQYPAFTSSPSSHQPVACWEAISMPEPAGVCYFDKIHEADERVFHVNSIQHQRET